MYEYIVWGSLSVAVACILWAIELYRRIRIVDKIIKKNEENMVRLNRIMNREVERDQVYGETMARWVTEKKELREEIERLLEIQSIVCEVVFNERHDNTLGMRKLCAWVHKNVVIGGEDE